MRFKKFWAIKFSRLFSFVKRNLFVRPHRYLERESRLYQRWLTFKFHKHVHIAIGSAFSILVIVFVASFIEHAFAATAWTQTDWSGGVGTSTVNQYSTASQTN